MLTKRSSQQDTAKPAKVFRNGELLLNAFDFFQIATKVLSFTNFLQLLLLVEYFITFFCHFLDITLSKIHVLTTMFLGLTLLLRLLLQQLSLRKMTITIVVLYSPFSFLVPLFLLLVLRCFEE
jgi:hypothetical protein